MLVAGPRSSGKRTLISAFVDLINRTRRDHVISIESEINVVHERGTSFISQREVRGSNDEVLTAARAALREDPDVLVIEELRHRRADERRARGGARPGTLVIGGFSAHSATGAIDRIIDLYAPEHRRQMQMALAEHVRGVVVQVLMRKIGGGRLAARELLLNTPAVASVIAGGQDVAAADGDRRRTTLTGWCRSTTALVGFVQSGDGRRARGVSPRSRSRRVRVAAAAPRRRHVRHRAPGVRSDQRRPGGAAEHGSLRVRRARVEWRVNARRTVPVPSQETTCTSSSVSSPGVPLRDRPLGFHDAPSAGAARVADDARLIAGRVERELDDSLPRRGPTSAARCRRA